MYTLKLDWSDERMDAVTDVLRAWLRDYPDSPHGADIRGALDDIILYRETTEEVIREITAQRGSYQQTAMRLVMEYRFPGESWMTFWDPMIPGEDWRRHLPSQSQRGQLEFRLLRRSTVITDEVLDTEG